VIARVFPRRTKATPIDEYAFVGDPPLLAMPSGIEEVHVSVTFTWHMAEAERLVRAWSVLDVPVRIGGPAWGTRGGTFEPGRYLRPGYVITSRGCPKRCWFCMVHQRDGRTRELTIRDGWDVLDDNLLACSDGHVRAVFDMLKRQPRRTKFTGGIDAALLKPWHAEGIAALHPDAVFLAYDEPADLAHVARACELLLDAGMTVAGKRLRCYVLCGYDGDTPAAAEDRMRAVVAMGAVPFAMLYRGPHWRRRASPEWRRFTWKWIRPAAITTKETGKSARKGAPKAAETLDLELEDDGGP
jgi:hypothetical protein